MKKVIALALAACTALCLCSCKKTEKAKSEIADLAKQGKMTESEFDLGTDPSVIINAFEDKKEELTVNEGESTVKLSLDNFDYHYYKSSKDNGISVIVNFGDAYGFENGQAMSDDVTKAIDGKYTLKTATPEQTYFLRDSAQNCEVLSYTFGNYRLEFYFIDYFLAATCLADMNYWQD